MEHEDVLEAHRGGGPGEDGLQVRVEGGEVAGAVKDPGGGIRERGALGGDEAELDAHGCPGPLGCQVANVVVVGKEGLGSHNLNLIWRRVPEELEKARPGVPGLLVPEEGEEGGAVDLDQTHRRSREDDTLVHCGVRSLNGEATKSRKEAWVRVDVVEAWAKLEIILVLVLVGVGLAELVGLGNFLKLLWEVGHIPKGRL